MTEEGGRRITGSKDESGSYQLRDKRLFASILGVHP